MKKPILLLLITLSLFTSNNCLACGEKGHAIVAEIAFNYLDANTKKIVLQYLDGMSIEEAANWMDDIKSEKKYDYMRKLHYINADKGQNIIQTMKKTLLALLQKLLMS